MLKKLVANVFGKEKRVIHYKILKLYLKLGLKIKKASCIRIQSVTMVKRIYLI